MDARKDTIIHADIGGVVTTILMLASNLAQCA
jgi:hypothetical protein